MLNIKDHRLNSRSTISTSVLPVPLVSSMKSVGRGVMCVSKHLVFMYFAVYACALFPIYKKAVA